MEKARTSLMIVAVLGLSVLCSSALAVDGNEPIAHWRFDEGSGTTAYDSAGDNNGIIYGAQWTTGQIDGALEFDGVDDYVDVGDPPDGSLDFGISTDFSISLWFNTSMSTAGLLVCKRAKGVKRGYDTYIQNAQIFARIADSSSVRGTSTTATFNDNFWHHLVVVYDRDDRITIYVDNVSEATSVSIAGIGNIDNSQPFTIGDRNDPGHHYYFDGTIDDARIYNRALSEEEIEQLYQEGGGGLISHWKFDEGSGAIAVDSVGGNDGTIYGATWTTGQLGGALDFDGSGDYVVISNEENFDFGSDTDFTICAWVKTTATFDRRRIVNKSRSGHAPYTGIEFFMDPPGIVHFRPKDNADKATVMTTTSVNDGFWHFVVGVADRDGDLRIYHNGILEDTASLAFVDNINNNVPLAIGRSMDYNGQYFDGIIDDVRIYNRALSAEEVQQLYQAAPVACVVGGDQAIEAGSGCEARVTLDGSCSSDADSTPGTNDDINDFDWYDVVDVCDPNSDIYLGSGEIIDCNLPVGEHIIILEVTDKAGAFDINEVTITVEDTTPPEFTLSVATDVLWPPNHKMIEIGPSWVVSDNCDESPDVSLVSITIEGDDAQANDDVQVDPNDGSIYLRAKRSGASGRVYIITYQAADDSGNVTVNSTTVTVPHDRR